MPTEESIRYQYIFECMITNQHSTLILGPNASGKSALIREMMFNQIYNFAQGVQVEHYTMTHHSDCATFKEIIEAKLDTKKDPPAPNAKDKDK